MFFFIMFLVSNPSIALWEEIFSTPNKPKNINNETILNASEKKNLPLQSESHNKHPVKSNKNKTSNHKNKSLSNEADIPTLPIKPINAKKNLKNNKKPSNNAIDIYKKTSNDIKKEIKKFGCQFVYQKYIIEKKIPKSYPSSHNWNEWSLFDIKKYQDLIYKCR